jgi:hypothetical protein
MRKQIIFRVETPGRDQGKTFQLNEMSADQGEKWAFRALLALSRGGMNLPSNVLDSGMAGLASIVPYLVLIALRSLNAVQWNELEPLLDEMMACVKYQPPQAGVPAQDLILGANSQTEEIRTRVELRKAILELHVDPSLAAVLQTSDLTSEAPKDAAAPTDTSNTPT